MAKVSIVQLKARKRSDGTAPLYLIIRNFKECSTFAIDVSLHPRHWNDKRRKVRKSYHEHRKLNEHLKQITERAELAALDVLLRDGKLTTRTVKDAMQQGSRETTPDFLTYFEKCIHESRDLGQHGSVAQRLVPSRDSGRVP